MLKTVFRWLLVLFYLAAGFNHFRVPDFYLGLMPPALPYPRELILISGAAEILGGIGAAIPFTRRLAGWGLIALLLAVFPANIYAALHGFAGMSRLGLWIRLPFQFLFIAWAWWTCLKPPAASSLPAASS